MRVVRFFKLMGEKGSWQVIYSSGNRTSIIRQTTYWRGSKGRNAWQAICNILKDRWRASKA